MLSGITREYNLDAAHNNGENAIPRAILPQRLAKPIPSRKIVKQIPAISGSTAGPSQTSIVRINTGNGAGFAVAGSFYLLFKLAVTQAANSWGFAGAVPDASALISRLTVSQSLPIEVIQNYNKYVTNIVKAYACHSTNMNQDSVLSGGQGSNNFLPNTYASTSTALSVASNTNFTYTDTNGTNGLITFAIPIVSGLLNSSSMTYIPLEIINQNIDLQIDWSTAEQAFNGLTTSITNYSITQLSLVYETVQVSTEYIDDIRSKMINGKLWSMPIQTCISTQVADASSISYNFSVNCSSVSAFFAGKVLAENQGSTTTPKYFSASTGSSPNSLGASGDQTCISKRVLLADGEQVLQVPNVNSDAQMLKECIRAICANVADPNYSLPFQTSGQWNIPGSYRGTFYLNGFNLRSWSEEDLVFCGRPVSLLNYQKDDTLARPTDTLYFFTIVDYIVLIDASGTISLVR
jgi:hypothetical protein